jgi:hypothetical protein
MSPAGTAGYSAPLSLFVVPSKVLKPKTPFSLLAYKLLSVGAIGSHRNLLQPRLPGKETIFAVNHCSTIKYIEGNELLHIKPFPSSIH